MAGFESIAELRAALARERYLVDEGLATVVFLALRLRRPLLVEGEPGVGKTELAKALARASSTRLIRLQCYEGIDVHHALYDWDYPRQLLHLRAEGTEQLYSERFLLRRPLLEALSADDAVLVIDELDRADDEFEAFLLEFLSDFQVTIPEIGVVRATTPPPVVITSNRTRELHEALKRRCLYHWIEHPDLAREVAIARAPPGTARAAAAAGLRLRSGAALARPLQGARRRRDARLGAGTRCPERRRRQPRRGGAGAGGAAQGARRSQPGPGNRNRRPRRSRPAARQ